MIDIKFVNDIVSIHEHAGRPRACVISIEQQKNELHAVEEDEQTKAFGSHNPAFGDIN